MPIPIVFAAERAALTQLYIDLALALHTSIYRPGQAPHEPDANLCLVAAAAVNGFATGRPMIAKEIERMVRQPHASVAHRLDALQDIGLLERIGDRYYLERTRAATAPPHLDDFGLILARAFAVLGPCVSKLDK
jgi:hypothetical protein